MKRERTPYIVLACALLLVLLSLAFTSGLTTWVGNFFGDAGGVTNIVDAALSSNVPLLNANQTFTSVNSFGGNVYLGGSSNWLGAAAAKSLTLTNSNNPESLFANQSGLALVRTNAVGTVGVGLDLTNATPSTSSTFASSPALKFGVEGWNGSPLSIEIRNYLQAKYDGNPGYLKWDYQTGGGGWNTWFNFDAGNLAVQLLGFNFRGNVIESGLGGSSDLTLMARDSGATLTVSDSLNLVSIPETISVPMTAPTGVVTNGLKFTNSVVATSGNFPASPAVEFDTASFQGSSIPMAYRQYAIGAQENDWEYLVWEYRFNNGSWNRAFAFDTLTSALEIGSSSFSATYVNLKSGGVTTYENNSGPVQLLGVGDVTLKANDSGGTLTVSDTTGVSTANLGLADTMSNATSLVQITFPGSTVNWTNAQKFNIVIYIDQSGVTGTALKKNGTTIWSSVLAGDLVTLLMKPGDYFSETYTIGTPVGRWEPQ